MRLRRPKPTYSNVTATLALFVALGGTSWAVAQLPRNSVGAAQLRAGSVTSAKVRDGSLGRDDFAADAIANGPRGPRGAVGPAGPAGALGGSGPRGPSDGYTHHGPEGSLLATQANVLKTFARLDDLSGGSYLLFASWHMSDFVNGESIAGCIINVNGEYLSGASSVIGVSNGSTRNAAMGTNGGVTRASPFQVTLECRTDHSFVSPPAVLNPRLTAIRVENLRATSG